MAAKILTNDMSNQVVEKLRILGKDKAFDFIKNNKDTLDANPYLKNQLTSVYSEAFSGVGTTPATTMQKTPVQDWNTIGKQSDPNKVSSFLNSQTDNSFNTRVSGNEVSGTKNGVQTTWKWDGQNWVVKNAAAPMQSWDTVGKQRDPKIMSDFLNSGGGNTRVNGNEVTGTKDGIQKTWAYDGENWVVKPDAKTLSQTQTWDTVGKQRDPKIMSDFLNSQGNTTSVNGNKVSGVKDGVYKTWAYDGENWVVESQSPVQQVTQANGNQSITGDYSDFNTLGYDYISTLGAIPGSTTPPKFTPDKSINGVAVNSQGKSTQEKYGLLDAQFKYLEKVLNQNKAKGLSVEEFKKLNTATLIELQKLNTTKGTFGSIPTQFTDTVGDMTDLNNNGIPDSQEGFGVSTKTGEDFTLTDPITNVTVTSAQNFTDVEKNMIEYDKAMLEQERLASEEAASVNISTLQEGARQLVENYDKYVTDLSSLLDERVKANEAAYEDAIGSVYSQLGGQVKQFQRIIGTDGKAIDDATMLALMGGVGVSAMSKVVDLKNQMLQDYLKQKEQTVKDIRDLESKKIITQNDADMAVNAIRAKSKSDVLTLTKNFYQKMFGMAAADDERTDNNLSNSRAAVTTYLSALGLNGAQVSQIVNNYVQAGNTPEQAINQLAEDIRNGANPVLNDIAKNNMDAARAAQAKFETDIALKIQPIVTSGEVKQGLQTDAQIFEAEQNELDRKLKLIGFQMQKSSGGGAAKVKQLTPQQRMNITNAGSNFGLVPNNINGWDGDLLSNATVSLSRIKQGTATDADTKLISTLFVGGDKVDDTKAMNFLQQLGTTTTEQQTQSTNQ